MDSDDNNKSGGHFDASLPLPADNGDRPDDSKRAADLVRKKVEAAYKIEPAAATDAADTIFADSDNKYSPHQKFLLDLTSSGKSLAEIQTAWHEYYAGLPDAQKHEVWQEFYQSHAQASHYAAAMPTMIIGKPEPQENESSRDAAKRQPRVRKAAAPKKRKESYDAQALKLRKRLTPIQHLQSWFFGVGVGAVVVLIFLFGFFNERFIAPFIQPSRNITNTPIISENTIASAAPEIIIPKINVEIPVVYGVDSVDPNVVEQALENGALHYADTAQPGQNGNVVIIGHSAVNLFVSGHYKYAFSLLRKLDNGDTFYLQKDHKRYTYEIYQKEVVKPTDIGVLGPTDKTATATLITCDPPGLNVNRLVVVGQQISPDPSSNLAANVNQNSLATTAAIVPGNSPSLWSKITHWFTH